MHLSTHHKCLLDSKYKHTHQQLNYIKVCLNLILNTFQRIDVPVVSHPHCLSAVSESLSYIIIFKMSLIKSPPTVSNLSYKWVFSSNRKNVSVRSNYFSQEYSVVYLNTNIISILFISLTRFRLSMDTPDIMLLCRFLRSPLRANREK